MKFIFLLFVFSLGLPQSSMGNECEGLFNKSVAPEEVGFQEYFSSFSHQYAIGYLEFKTFIENLHNSHLVAADDLHSSFVFQHLISDNGGMDSPQLKALLEHSHIDLEVLKKWFHIIQNTLNLQLYISDLVRLKIIEQPEIEAFKEAIFKGRLINPIDLTPPPKVPRKLRAAMEEKMEKKQIHYKKINYLLHLNATEHNDFDMLELRKWAAAGFQL